MNDFATSLIRTFVPLIVGSIAAWLAARGINISSEDAAGLAAFLAAVFAGLYYLLIRLIERKHPGAGALLGAAKQPEYTATAKEVNK
jgi:hypothetical protein